MKLDYMTLTNENKRLWLALASPVEKTLIHVQREEIILFHTLLIENSKLLQHTRKI